jgi:ADP-ribosylglycohydrolase
MMRETRLFEKIHGCIMGAAMGDAFGIRVEMMHYRDIAAQYGRVEHFDRLPPREPSQQPPLERWNPFAVQMQGVGGYHPLGRWSHEVGAYTDDMRYRLLAYHAMLKKNGPITGRDFAAEWLNYRLMAEGAAEYEPTLSWPGPQREYARYVASLDGLMRMAAEHRPCHAGWDGPVGVLHPGDPAAAAEYGYPMAVAVAAALSPDADMDSVIAAVLRHTDCLGRNAAEFTARLERLLEIATKCRDASELYEPFYRDFLVTFPPWDSVWIMEMIPAALAVCYVAKDDPAAAIIGAANLGRDADTIASIAGELMGALHGVDALPAEWVEQVERLNPEPDMAEMAAGLATLAAARAQDAESRARKTLALAS